MDALEYRSSGYCSNAYPCTTEICHCRIYCKHLNYIKLGIKNISSQESDKNVFYVFSMGGAWTISLCLTTKR